MRRRNSKKIDPRGAVVELTKRVIVRSERGLSGSGAPASGGKWRNARKRRS